MERLRDRQVKNFFIATLLSAGVPMFLMGDEVRRSQRGNNNAYCQDNEISWFDWSLLHKHGGVHRFVRHLIAFRLKREVPVEDPGLSLNEILSQARFQWHGVKLNQPDWGTDSHSLAMTAFSIRDRLVFHIMINAFWEELRFEVPPAADLSRSDWVRWIDTFRESPDDICYWEKAAAVPDDVYLVKPRSVVILVAGMENYGKQ